MRHFHLTFPEYCLASQELWIQQDRSGQPRSQLHASANGTDTDLSVPDDPIGEALLRVILHQLGISFEEGDTPFVHTWLDDAFGVPRREDKKGVTHGED